MCENSLLERRPGPVRFLDFVLPARFRIVAEGNHSHNPPRTGEHRFTESVTAFHDQTGIPAISRPPSDGWTMAAPPASAGTAARSES